MTKKSKQMVMWVVGIVVVGGGIALVVTTGLGTKLVDGVKSLFGK